MDSTIAVISLAVTTLVSLGLFVWQLAVKQQQARRDSHEQALEQVMDALTVVVRRLDQPALLRPWFKPELEFALVVPRLVLRLAKSDAVVGQWAMRQVQLVQRASSDREAARIGIAMTAVLTEWHHGTRSLTWFTGDLVASPLEPNGIPWRARFRRQVSRTGEQLLGVGGLVLSALIIAVAAGLALRPFGPNLSRRTSHIMNL